MKNINYSFIMAAFVLGVSTPVWALDSNVHGTVKSIDANSITVTTEVIGPDQTIEDFNFELNENTRFDRLSSMNDIREGDTVKVSYTEEDSRLIATSVAEAPGLGADASLEGPNPSVDQSIGVPQDTFQSSQHELNSTRADDYGPTRSLR